MGKSQWCVSFLLGILFLILRMYRNYFTAWLTRIMVELWLSYFQLKVQTAQYSAAGCAKSLKIKCRPSGLTEPCQWVF